MTIYADILIITNFITDYFLLRVTFILVKQKPPLWRQISAALFAALTTLTIFLPGQNAFLEFALRLAISLIICLIAFGYRGIRRLIYCGLTFFGVTFCYAGAIFALWYVFRPAGVVIRNSVVYFDVSPLFLIIFSAAGFILFTVFSSVFAARHKRAEHCYVTLTFCGKSADFSAIIDSGNSLSDPFSAGTVIIVDPAVCRRAFGQLSAESQPLKYRAIPCGTVSGSGLLDGFRCESGKIIFKNRALDVCAPIMAISKTPLCDCEAIVNPLDCD